MKKKYKVYDEEGTYFGDLDEILEEFCSNLINELKSGFEVDTTKRYKVSREEECPIWFGRCTLGRCNNCHRERYCESYDKVEF